MPAAATVPVQRAAQTKGIVLPRVDKTKDIVLEGIEVFAAGVWQGDTYTIADLDRMVSNFAELYPVIEPPAKVGHDEDQEFSGVPAVGWVTRLWREGPKLFADVEQVFPDIADLIEAGAYKKVSAEIYPKDEPPEGVKANGYILKAISFLGGEMPHLKHLSELPKPRRFSEKERRKPQKPVVLRLIRSLQTRSSHKVFFEVIPVDRKALEDQLAGIGFTAEMIAAMAGLSDEDFSKFVLAALAAKAGAPPVTEPTPAAPVAAAEVMWPDGMDRNAVVAELVAMGEDQVALDAMTDEELIARWEEKKAMSERPPANPATPAASGGPKKVVYSFAEVRDQVRAEGRAVRAEVARFREEVKREKAVRVMSEAASRKVLIDSVCEARVKEGRWTPAQVEVGKDGKTIGVKRLRLERANAVRKFADKPSELELQIKESESDPIVRKYGEQIPDPVHGQQHDDVTARAKQWAAKRNGRKTA